MSIRNYYYSSPFLFLIIVSSFLLLISDNNNNRHNAYAESNNNGSITITFDTNPRISPIIIDEMIYMPEQQPITLSWKNDSSIHTFSIPETSVYENVSKKYVFETWNDLNKSPTRTIQASAENDNMQLLALFNTQYLLTILSDYGTPKGAGWYELGEMANVEIEPTISLSRDTRAVFNGWSQGYLPNSAENHLEISKPTVIVATWKEQYKLRIESDIGSQDEDRRSKSTNNNYTDSYIMSRSSWQDKDSIARIDVPQEVQTREDGQQKKLIFKEWKSRGLQAPQINDIQSSTATIVMDQPYVIQPQWTEMYYVKVDSNYGNPSGGDYYELNQVAKISVESSSEIEPDKVRRSFAGWQEENSNSGYSLHPAGNSTISEGNTFYVIVDEPKSFTSIWTTEYFVNVKSAYGITEGNGWYGNGSNAVVSVQQPTVNLGFGKSAIFEGWSLSTSADLSPPTLSKSSSYVINNIDRPYEVHAIWRVDETPRYITIMAALGATGALILSYTMTSKRKGKNV